MNPDADILQGAVWRKSRHSNPNGACVEVAVLPGANVAIRDSKNQRGPVQVFSRAAFSAFLGGVKNGEFDDLM